MATFWERVQGIKDLNSARQQAAQDASIKKAQDFWNRLPSAAQSLRDHQYAYQDAMIEAGKRDGLAGVLGISAVTNGNNGIKLNPAKPGSPGNDDESPSYEPSSGSGASLAAAPLLPQQIEYINADLAKHYQMDVTTAYQEALANTAYQREIKDMKAAGLNPAVLYGAGSGNGASVFSGRSAASSGGGGGGGGGGSRRSGSKTNSGKKLFTQGEYYGLSTAAGLITAVVTKNPGNYWIGSTATQGILTALNGWWKGR